MPLPNILEFIGTNITQRKFQQAMDKLLNFTDELDKRQSATANGYYKSYATLAAANADIANIPFGTSVKVLSAENGGDYYKAGESSTSLTKSAYDPELFSKNYIDSIAAPINEVLDKNSEQNLDESVDKNLNVYRYTDKDGGLHLAGLDESVQESFAQVKEQNKNIPTTTKDNILNSFEDSIGNVVAYIDTESNLNLVNDIIIKGKSLTQHIKNQDNQMRFQNILSNREKIKNLIPIAEKSEDSLIKRMPAAIKTPTGLVYFYHKQVIGYDGDNTGSELWKAILSIDSNLNVSVKSRELFLAPDEPRGIVKHPMLGRTSDNRIILIFEKRLETSDFYTRYQCFSSDEGLTFTQPMALAYAGINPAGSSNSALGTTGTIVTAKNGRLIVPMYTAGGACYCIYSDDDGATWTYSGWVDTTKVSGFEPGISLDLDNNLVMDVRPKAATYRLKAKSIDNGETWQAITTQQVPTSTNQGAIFCDKDIGLMIQANNANQAFSRTKYSLFLSYDNCQTYPFVYMPFAPLWYGGYSQIIKWSDGIYIISIEYADSFIDVNKNENAGLLILSLSEVLAHVSRN